MKSLAFKDRICILYLDEICLKTGITYDKRFDVLVGYENLGEKKTSKPANNALTLLVRDLFSNWKQPLGFMFTNVALKDMM